MKKLISITIILLFIGLAFAPSINANVGKEELVEFTTEVCGLNGGKQTVKLTKKEAEEVETLFDLINMRLNATKSREEAEVIFKEAVVQLVKYGLLGGLSVKQAQRLVTGGYQYEIANIIMDIVSLKNKPLLDDNENLFCLIAGETDNTIIEGYVSRFFSIFFPLFGLFGGKRMPMIGYWLDTTIPIALGHRIGLGANQILWNLTIDANGWVHTNGINGVKYWNGSLRGDLSLNFRIIFSKVKMRYPFVAGLYEIYQGVQGFRGIKVYSNTSYSFYYMGFATIVKIIQEPF